MVDWNSPLWIAVSVLAGAGALNWGLDVFADLNLVTEFVAEPGLQAGIYAVVAVAGGLLLYAEAEKFTNMD